MPFVMKKRMILTILTVMLIAGSILSYILSNPIPADVQTVKIDRGKIIDRIQVTGRVEAAKRVVIRAKETVRIEKLRVKEGDTINPDQELIDIDMTVHKDAVKTATLKLEQAKIEVSGAYNRLKASERTYSDPSELELHLQRRQTDYQAALIEKQTCEREYKISKELYDKDLEPYLNLVKKEDRFKKAEVRLKQAAQELEAARQAFEGKDKTVVNRERLKSDYELALRSKDLATASLEMTKARLGRLKVVSPIQGSVVQIDVEEGMVVQAGQSLMTVCDLSQLQVRATIDEIDGGRVMADQPTVITFEAFPNMQFHGHVEQIASQAVVRNDRTMVEAVIGIDKPTDLLKIANQVDVQIVIQENDNVLLMPLAAIHYGNLPFVWRCRDGRAQKTLIQTGVANLDTIEITAGLKAGDRVILNRDLLLYDGMPVNTE